MREGKGGNIDRSCFVRRKFMWKKRGERKRKFVVIIWERWKNRGKRREIRAVFAPRQAVYSSKLYLMFPVLVTLVMPVPCTSCMRLANSPSSSMLPHPANQSLINPSSLTQSNQSHFYSLAIFHFIVWQSKNHQSYFYLGCWETNQPIKSPSIAVTVQICTCFARLWCGQKVRNLTLTYGSFGNLIIKNHPVPLAMTGLEVNLIINLIAQKWEIRLLPRILRKINLVQNMAVSL